jgi:hypothetical protein
MKQRQGKSSQLKMPDDVVMGRFIAKTGQLVNDTCENIIYLPVKKTQLTSQKSCSKKVIKENEGWLSRIFD